MDLSDLSSLLGEDTDGATQRDIWVVAPATHIGQQLHSPALIAEARRLADALGCYVHAVIDKEDLAVDAIALGADRVHVTPARIGYLATQQPEFILLPSLYNMDAARIAQRLGAGLITDTTWIEIDAATRGLRGAHPVFDGEFALDLEVTTLVKMATV